MKFYCIWDIEVKSLSPTIGNSGFFYQELEISLWYLFFYFWAPTSSMPTAKPTDDCVMFIVGSDCLVNILFDF